MAPYGIPWEHPVILAARYKDLKMSTPEQRHRCPALGEVGKVESKIWNDQHSQCQETLSYRPGGCKWCHLTSELGDPIRHGGWAVWGQNQEGFRGEPDAVTEVPNLVTSVQNLGRVKVSNMWHVLPHFWANQYNQTVYDLGMRMFLGE